MLLQREEGSFESHCLTELTFNFLHTWWTPTVPNGWNMYLCIYSSGWYPCTLLCQVNSSF